MVADNLSEIIQIARASLVHNTDSAMKHLISAFLMMTTS